MQLSIPTVGVDTGPSYAYNINTSLNLIDAHDHSSGKGVQITPSGMNINTSLSFQGSNATSMGAVVFQNQTSLSTLNALYVIGSELWYNDTTSAIQITSNGAVNATSSGISSGTASAAFAAGVLQVYSNLGTSTPGNVQCGSVLLGNNTAGSNFLTLQPPSLTGGGYALTLPTIPVSTKFLTIDTSGNISTVSNVSGAQIAAASLTGSQLSASANILGSQLSASAGIVGTQLASNTVAVSNMASVSSHAATGGSYSNTSYDGFSNVVSVSASGLVANRPLIFSFSGPLFTLTDTSSAGTTFTFEIFDSTDSISIATWTCIVAAAATIQVQPSFNFTASIGVSSTATFALRAKGKSNSVGFGCSLTAPSGVAISVIQV